MNFDDLSSGVMKKIASVKLCEKYITGKSVKTILKGVDDLMSFDKNAEYQEKIGSVSAGLEMLSEIILLRKFKNNPDDMRIIVEKIKDTAEMVMDCYE